jgi:hypothetical protein
MNSKICSQSIQIYTLNICSLWLKALVMYAAVTTYLIRVSLTLFPPQKINVQFILFIFFHSFSSLTKMNLFALASLSLSRILPFSSIPFDYVCSSELLLFVLAWNHLSLQCIYFIQYITSLSNSWFWFLLTSLICHFWYITSSLTIICLFLFL